MSAVEPVAVDTTACLLAGRRAAYAELATVIHETQRASWRAGSSTPEQYTGVTAIIVNNANITPFIDAAVREAIVQLTAGAALPSRRRWWMFWRGTP